MWGKPRGTRRQRDRSSHRGLLLSCKRVWSVLCLVWEKNLVCIIYIHIHYYSYPAAVCRMPYETRIPEVGKRWMVFCSIGPGNNSSYRLPFVSYLLTVVYLFLPKVYFISVSLNLNFSWGFFFLHKTFHHIPY